VGLQSDLAKLFGSFRENGILATTEAVWTSMRVRAQVRQDLRFDAGHGVDTGGAKKLSEFTIESENREYGLEYEPTPVPLCRWLLRRLPEVEDFVFVDFGSGKGRMLLIASEYPFRRIVGVEFAAELHEAAVRNIENFRSPRQRCKNLEALSMDAAVFPIPDEKCVFYFYVPFRPPLMNKVLERIGDSYRANPRKMYILFVKPWFGIRGIFDELQWLKSVSIRKPWWMSLTPDPMEVLMYETRDQEATGQRAS